MASLSALPSNLLDHIVDFLPLESIWILRLANRRLHSIVWKALRRGRNRLWKLACSKRPLHVTPPPWILAIVDDPSPAFDLDWKEIYNNNAFSAVSRWEGGLERRSVTDHYKCTMFPMESEVALPGGEEMESSLLLPYPSWLVDLVRPEITVEASLTETGERIPFSLSASLEGVGLIDSGNKESAEEEYEIEDETVERYYKITFRGYGPGVQKVRVKRSRLEGGASCLYLTLQVRIPAEAPDNVQDLKSIQ